jgi:hypothetical protein
MKEIGGYLELDRYNGSIFHEGAVALNCGRNCLAYLIKTKKIKKLYLPYFCCDSVAQPCRKYGVEIERYHIDVDFRPVFDKVLETDEWLYIVNFYGQINNDEVKAWKKQFGRVILDNAQAYFQKPVYGVDTIYTCRKFFGVADGAFMYTQDRPEGLERDESFNRMRFVLGRFERTAGEFYKESADNNEFFTNEPVKLMSKLTDNFLRGIDYFAVEKRRTENFSYLHKRLRDKNKLHLTIPTGAYMYPFYCENGAMVRKSLQTKKIFIPILWPDVLDICKPDTLEYDHAMNILPLPVDQRYKIEDMEYIAKLLWESSEENND